MFFPERYQEKLSEYLWGESHYFKQTLDFERKHLIFEEFKRIFENEPMIFAKSVTEFLNHARKNLWKDFPRETVNNEAKAYKKSIQLARVKIEFFFF